MEKMQKKALVIGLIFVVILNLFVIGWLISDLFGGREEDSKGTVSSTEEITMGESTTEEITAEELTTQEPTTEEPATEEPTTEAVVIEHGNIHTDETVPDTGEIVQVIEVGKTLLADLDGDGVDEKITLRTDKERNQYNHDSLHFQVNDLYYHGIGKFAELVPGGGLSVSESGFSLVDLDKSDNFKEIVIHESTSDPICFFRYQDGVLIPIGTVPGTLAKNSGKLDFLTIPGDGTVSMKVDCDLIYTYVITKTWKLVNGDYFHSSLEEVNPEYYEIDSQIYGSLWLCREMTFYAEMNGSADNLVTVPEGTEIRVVRYYPEEGWIQILCEQDAKVVWLKYMKKLILPMNIFDEDFKLNYTQRGAVAG